MTQQLIWHYTTEDLLDQIVDCGLLRISQWEKQAKLPHPALWFSAHPEWEPTATKVAMDEEGNTRDLTKEEQYEMTGLGRIGVVRTPDFVSWQQYRHSSGLHPQVVARIEQVALERDARLNEWYASFRSIPKAKWQTVEIWDGEKWVSYWEE